MMEQGNVTETTTAMRQLLLVAAILVFIIGIPLLFATTQTETYFAWTIATPLTAAFLGGSYWAAGILEYLASRERNWCNARIAVPAVFVFTILTLIVTLIHIDRFHLSADAPITLAVTWAWLIVYAVVPVLMTIILVVQVRSRAPDEPRLMPLPSVVRTMLVAQGATLGATGLALLFAPSTAGAFWPWSLTPLTAQAIGVWLFSVGLGAVHVAWENDHTRIRPWAVAYVALAILQFIALARFAGDFAWGTISGALYLTFLAWILLVGVALNAAPRRSDDASEWTT